MPDLPPNVPKKPGNTGSPDTKHTEEHPVPTGSPLPATSAAAAVKPPKATVTAQSALPPPIFRAPLPADEVSVLTSKASPKKSAGDRTPSYLSRETKIDDWVITPKKDANGNLISQEIKKKNESFIVKTGSMETKSDKQETFEAMLRLHSKTYSDGTLPSIKTSEKLIGTWRAALRKVYPNLAEDKIKGLVSEHEAPKPAPSPKSSTPKP